VNTKGYRTVGGLRCSIYNAMPMEGIEVLIEVLEQFKKENA
jgi:phosphoserine aminotransferase